MMCKHCVHVTDCSDYDEAIERNIEIADCGDFNTDFEGQDRESYSDTQDRENYIQEE